MIGILVILGKAFSLGRDALMASHFALSDTNSIYAFSIRTTMLFISIGYGLTTTFIPIHTGIIEKDEIEYRNKFTSNVINISLIVSIIIVLLGVFFAKEIVTITQPSFLKDENVFNSAVLLVRVMFMSLLFVSIQSVVAGVLQCHNQFIEPAAMAIFSSLISIIYLSIFLDKFGIIGYGVSNVIGFGAMMAINLPKFHKLGYSYKFYIDIKDINLKKIGKMLPTVVICSSLIQITLYILSVFAGRISNESISAMNYASSVNLIVYEVFAVAINMVVFPMLSKLISREDLDGYKKAFVRAFNMIMLIMVPAAVGVFVLRHEIITVYLKRGIVSESNVLFIASVLIFYIPSMVAYGLKDLLNRAFYSIQKTKQTLYNSILTIILTIVFCIPLMKYFKTEGLAMATTLAMSITSLILFWELNKSLKGLDVKKIFLGFIKIFTSSIIMGFEVVIVRDCMIGVLGNTIKGSLITILLCGIIGAVSYSILTLLMKVDEISCFYIQVKNKIIE